MSLETTVITPGAALDRAGLEELAAEQALKFIRQQHAYHLRTVVGLRPQKPEKAVQVKGRTYEVVESFYGPDGACHGFIGISPSAPLLGQPLTKAMPGTVLVATVDPVRT